MKFIAPLWLWGLLAVPLVALFMIQDEERRKRLFSRFIGDRLWPVLAPEADWGARKRKAILWCLAMAFALLALARPQWGTHEETIRASGLDVMVVLDLSNSMDTEDIAPSRLKKAKHVIKNLLDRVAGDRVGVAGFAGSAYVASPLTVDTDYIWGIVQGLSPKTIQSQGTDIGTGLEVARRAIERGGEGPGEGAESKNAKTSHAILLISDGEDHEDSASEAAKKIKDSGIRLYVLGVGTQKGGPIPVRDENGNLQGYKKDSGGQAVVSTFHPDELIQIAGAGGGRYWNISSDESEVEELLKDLGALNRADFAERTYLVYEERYQFPLAIAVILLLIEISLSARGTGLPKAAAGLLLLLAIWGAGERAAGASELDSYHENQKGLKAYEEGKIEDAAQSFGRAQAIDPNSPELHFNEGDVRMKQGDVDSAIHSFEDAARGALGRGNDALAGQALYNLGVAEAKKGDFKAALKSYVSAVEAAQKAKDQRLEEDARKNIELLAQQKKDKQQQQKDDQKNQDKQDKEGKDQKDQQQKDQKDQKDQQQ
ncbi:MAG: vWA domain-containing protein, partial [Bdellovibrionota bacterium]